MMLIKANLRCSLHIHILATDGQVNCELTASLSKREKRKTSQGPYPLNRVKAKNGNEQVYFASLICRRVCNSSLQRNTK